MSTRPGCRQLTLFDDLEVPVPVSVESPLHPSTHLDQVDHVPAIDVSRIRRQKPPNQPELDGPLARPR